MAVDGGPPNMAGHAPKKLAKMRAGPLNSEADARLVPPLRIRSLAALQISLGRALLPVAVCSAEPPPPQVPFLLWALTPPGYMPELHLGVRSVKSQKLMAIITGVPATVCRTQRRRTVSGIPRGAISAGATRISAEIFSEVSE